MDRRPQPRSSASWRAVALGPAADRRRLPDRGRPAGDGPARLAGPPHHAAHRRFGRIVMDVKGERFDEALESAKHAHGAAQDTDLDAAALQAVAEEFKAIVLGRHGPPVPDRPLRPARPRHQGRLRELVRQAGDGLSQQPEDRPRSRHGRQRRHDGLRQHGRRLRHGRRVHPRPEYRREGPLRRVPDQRPGRGRRGGHPDRAEDQPDADGHARGLRGVPAHRPNSLERHYRDVQDLEFTIERGKLYMLQTRSAKRPRRRP